MEFFSDLRNQIYLLNTNHSAISNGDLAKLRTFLITNCVINACTSFSAAFGNGIVLMTIWKSRSLHSPSNTLLFGLALTDFSVGTFIQPMEVAKCLFSLLTKEGSPKELNSAFDVLSVILSGASLVIVTFISIDRYLMFYLHMRYQMIVTTKKVIVFIAFGFLTAGLLGLVWTLDRSKAYYCVVISLFSIGFSIIVLMYFKIFRIVRRHQTQIKTQTRMSSQRKNTSHRFLALSTKSAVNTFYICFFLFLFCFPYNCISIVIQVTGWSVNKYIVLQLAGTVVFMNSSLNPLVYLWRVVEIRKAVQRLLRCPWSTSSRRAQSENRTS